MLVENGHISALLLNARQPRSVVIKAGKPPKRLPVEFYTHTSEFAGRA